MKKTLLSMLCLITALTGMAQGHGSMNFVGNSTFSASTASQDNTKDTVVVSDGNTSVTLPVMYYKALNMTLPSIKFIGLSYVMTGSFMTGDMAFTWQKEYADTLITLEDGTEKHLTNATLTVKYTHSTGELTVDATFNYGSMPFPINYKQTGYYTVDNAWNLVGRGTAANPYKIYEAADFKSIADNITADNTGEGEYFLLMNDIDFEGASTPNIGYKGIANEQIGQWAWGFNGNFDGDNHTISGIVNENKNAKFQSLFSSVGLAGYIKNVNISADNTLSAYNYVAPIASLSCGTIENCVNYANITASNAFASGIAGGLVKGEGVIKDCKNYGNVTSMTYATGIIAASQSGATITTYNYLVENCQNYGTMSNTNATTAGNAGIAGSYSGSLKNCTNYGNIEGAGKQYVGGVASCMSYVVTVDGCVNEGTVTCGKNSGGVIGFLMKGDNADVTITNCKNLGAVTATDGTAATAKAVNVGGILGSQIASRTAVTTLKDCENSGVVTATTDGYSTTGNLRGNENIVLDNCTIAAGLEALPLDPQTDAIATATAAGASTANTIKVLKNGRLVIVKNGNEYNAAGAAIK